MRNRRITDTDAAAVMGGTAPADRPDLADVATALSEVRGAVFMSLPQPSTELRERLENGAAVSSPEGTKRSRAGGARRMFAWLTGLGLAAKIVLGSVVAVAAVGGAGAAGVLPGAVQTAFDSVISTEQTTPVVPTEEPSGNPSGDPSSDPTEDSTDDEAVEGPAEGENFGSYVSEEAQNKEGTGREFGEQISDLAKDNGRDGEESDDSGTDSSTDSGDDSSTDSTTDQGSGKPSGGGTGGKKH